MTRDPEPTPPQPDRPGQPPQPTTRTEEWGDRVETGRQIARGGKSEGSVPGATGDEPADPRSGQSSAGNG